MSVRECHLSPESTPVMGRELISSLRATEPVLAVSLIMAASAASFLSWLCGYRGTEDPTGTGRDSMESLAFLHIRYCPLQLPSPRPLARGWLNRSEGAGAP